MQPFTTLTAVAAPLEIAKVDTGMILPGRFMRRHRRPGHDYADAFLHDLRFDDDGAPRPDFPLNIDAWRDAQILVTGADFGCGSSREGAAYAVLDAGLRALVAPSFGEIFQGNCLQNGVLPVVLPSDVVEDLWRRLRAHPGTTLTIDLPAQLLHGPDGRAHPFEIPAIRKQRLIRGQDDVAATLEHIAAIERFEAERRAAQPWLPTTEGAA